MIRTMVVNNETRNSIHIILFCDFCDYCWGYSHCVNYGWYYLQIYCWLISMKTLACHRCGKCLGEISKGKIKRDAVIVCNECMALINIMIQPKQNESETTKDIFKDMFGA